LDSQHQIHIFKFYGRKYLNPLYFPSVICGSSIAYQYEANDTSRVSRMDWYSTMTFAHYLCHCMPDDDKGELHL